MTDISIETPWRRDPERLRGRFERWFGVKRWWYKRVAGQVDGVNRERVQAKFANGMLEIELPKREEAKPRQIKVSAGSGNGGKKETIDVKAR